MSSNTILLLYRVKTALQLEHQRGVEVLSLTWRPSSCPVGLAPSVHRCRRAWRC